MKKGIRLWLGGAVLAAGLLGLKNESHAAAAADEALELSWRCEQLHTAVSLKCPNDPHDPACASAELHFCDFPAARPQSADWSDELRGTHWKPVTAKQISAAVLKLAPKAQLNAGTRGNDSSGVGGVAWQGQLIEGLTAFVLERAQAEAMLSLLETMKTDLCGSGADAGTAELSLRQAFLATCRLLDTTDSTRLPTLGATWRAAFAADLEALPQRLLPKYLEAAKLKSAEVTEFVEIARELVETLRRGGDPLVFMSGLADRYNPAGKLGTSEVLCDAHHPSPVSWFKHALWSVGILAQGMQQSKSGDALKQLLAFAQSASPVVCNSVFPKDFESRILALKAVIAQASGDDKSGAAASPAMIVRYVRVAFSAIELIAQIPPDEADRKVIGLAVEMARQVLDISDAVLLRDYGRAVVALVRVLDKLVELAQGQADKSWEVYLRRLLRLANLAADVASAKTADDVRQAFRSAAEPVGGYRLKRQAHVRSVSITALLGAAGGYEYTVGGGQAAHGAQLGLWAPVGIDASLGLGGKSVGVFLSAIDLGALVNYRLTGDNSEVKSTPEIGIQQIFSPGLFFSLGLTERVPLVIGAGAELTPNLRRIESAEPGLQAHALRVSAFLAFDLTLFRLY